MLVPLVLALLQQPTVYSSPPGGDTTGYWQQRAAYTIVATLDESASVLRATGTLTYVNNSPDTLRELYVHQHLNAFRPGSAWSAVDERERRVRFHGTLPEDEVAALMQRSDLFVLPSLIAPDGNQEGLPNVLLEALATGTPAVATATAGAPELLREEATCLLAMPDDAASLAAALEHVLAHPEAAMRRAEAGRRLIERQYGLTRAGEEMAALLRGSP